jgi:hypothetical protein
MFDGVYIYSSDDDSIISKIAYHSAWSSGLDHLNNQLEQCGRYFGLIMIDERGDWCVDQERPVLDGFIFFRQHTFISEELSDFIDTCDKIKERLNNGFYG